MSSLTVKTVTIPGSGFITAEIDLGLPGLRKLAMVGNWAAAPLTFLVPAPTGTGWNFTYDMGNLIVMPVVPGAYIELDRWLWRGVDKLKIMSGLPGAPIVQPIDASIALIGSFLSGGPVLPNPRRRIGATCVGWNGAFPTFSLDDDDVVTFDLKKLLVAGETIASVDRFDLTVSDVAGNGHDATPASRTLGVAAVSGTMVSQRFGDWPETDWIEYTAELGVTTSMSNSFVVSADVNVRASLE